MAKYAAAVDQGTTSTRFMVFDHSGQVVSVDQKEHEQIYPKPGWVEHDPMEIWVRTQEVIKGGLLKANIDPKDIAAVGVTNQRETTVVWEKATGKPIYNAIVWQDTRTDTICNTLAKDGGQDRFRAKVGLPLATYFSGPKIRWILDNVPGARERAEKGEILFGNIDTWVIWNLTGGPNGGAHVTDVTNASRTMLMNLETLDWDDEILGIMGVPKAMLPEVRPPAKFMALPWAIWQASRSLATWATSRPRSSDRPATTPARPKTPMARVASCCSTPAPSPSSPRAACSPRWATRSATNRLSTPWKAPSPLPAR
jgi:glycerol kinase